MKYTKAGEYELNYTAEDECGNETSEVRSVLVAREIIAGDNITLEQSGNDVTVNADLSDYYKKSETYSKTEVNDLVDAIDEFKVEIVQALPQTGEEKKIYLVPKQSGGYTEHLYINNAWEEIGDTDIDLSDYYTKTETDNLLNAKQDTISAGSGIKVENNEVSLGYTIGGGGLSNQTIPAGGRKALVVNNVAPTGYVIASYRQISIAKGDSVSDTNWQKCFIQFFSTTGQGRNAQVAVVNSGTSDAVINLSVACLCIKE